VNLAVDVPLLSALSKVEQAKLLSDMEILSFPAGMLIQAAGESATWVYFLMEGHVELSGLEDGEAVPIMVLGPGDLFGEGGLMKSVPEGLQAKAVDAVHLARLPVSRFARLLQTEPGLARDLLETIANRSASLISEMARVKRMLSAYAAEVWSAIPPAQQDDAVAAMAPESDSTPQLLPPRRRSKSTKSEPLSPVVLQQLKTGAGVVVSTILAFLVFHFNAGPYPLAMGSAILAWAACNWLLGILPDYATALIACALAVMFKVAAPAISFSGFANPSWYLLLGVLGIGVAVNRSGLLYRLALHMLRLLPSNYMGQSLALGLTGVMFTPLLPSANSRSAMASPLARELSEAMHFPQLGKGAAGLAMASFLGFGQMYFLFLNGTNICLLAWSLLPDVVRSKVTWLYWLGAALPLGLLIFAGSYGAILAMFRPEPTSGVSRQTIRAQLKVLGPVTSMERSTAWVLSLVLLGFITQDLHGIDPSWIALFGFLTLVAIGIIDKTALKTIDWSFLLLVGALVSLSDVTKATGLTDSLTGWIGPLLQPLGHSPYLFLGAVAVLTLLARLAVPIQQVVLVMVVSLTPVGIQLGYSPFVVALVVLTLSNAWILPQQNSMYLTVFSGTEERCFTHKQVRGLSLVHAGIEILAILASVPFWHYLGLVPNWR
jgi:anion transporter